MAIDSNVLQEVVDALKQDPEIKNNVYQATVSRIDGEGVVWVNIAGSDTETPTAITSAEVAPGDSVNVEWRNNKLYIGGNYSNPSAGVVRVANVEQIADVAVANASRAQTAAANAEISAQSAQESASAASTAAGNALTAAGTAQTAADSALVGLSTVEDVVGVLNWITAHGTMTSQSGGTFDPDQVYFVMDDSTPGDYHVGSHYYSIVSEPKAADINSYYVLTVDESVQNYVATHLAVDTEGLWIIPDVGGNKVLIAVGGAGHTYETAGTYIVGKVGGVDTVLAEFTASGAVIGENASGKSRSEITADGMQIYRNVNGADTQIALLGYGLGASGGGTADAPYYTFGYRKTSALPYDSSVTWSIGNMCIYNDQLYVCIHEITTPEAWNSNHWRYYIGNYSVAEGEQPISCGYASHAEGVDTEAIGHDSHAEGNATNAIGECSHAEGIHASANGDYSHAEGGGTSANGDLSHAEGYEATASGDYSHAQNYSTKASSDSQTALGKYNVEDNTDTYAVIVGNGTADNARSNALTVDWRGNVEAAGKITSLMQDYATMYPSSDFSVTSTSSTMVTPLTISGCLGRCFEKQTNQVKVLKSGVYLVNAMFMANSVGNTTSIKQVSLYVNGSNLMSARMAIGAMQNVTQIITYTFSAGDILTMYTQFGESSGTRKLSRNTHIDIFPLILT